MQKNISFIFLGQKGVYFRNQLSSQMSTPPLQTNIRSQQSIPPSSQQQQQQQQPNKTSMWFSIDLLILEQNDTLRLSIFVFFLLLLCLVVRFSLIAVVLNTYYVCEMVEIEKKDFRFVFCSFFFLRSPFHWFVSLLHFFAQFVFSCLFHIIHTHIFLFFFSYRPYFFLFFRNISFPLCTFVYVWRKKGDAGSPTCIKKRNRQQTDACARMYLCVYVWLYVCAQTKQTYTFSSNF